MSRVGSQPIAVPSGVEVSVDGSRVVVKSSKTTLEHEVPEQITVQFQDNEIVTTRRDDSPTSKALHGLSRALIANLVIGVSEGFVRSLDIIGVGYRAQAKGPDKLELQLGFSHPVTVEAPEGVSFEVPEPTKIFVKGADKQAVGQVAANIRKLRPPEPYKGKGIRYTDEYVPRKAGKSAK